MNFSDLSSAELRVYRGVLALTAALGRPPGLIEVAAYLKVTHVAVFYHVRTLRARGFLIEDTGRGLTTPDLAAKLSQHALDALAKVPLPNRTRHDPK